MVTNHDAFGYYIDHFQFVGSVIPSFESTAELSGRDIRELVAKIKATGVKAVFSETSLPPKTAEASPRETGVEVVVEGHPRARSSGHDRYPADSHGQSKRAGKRDTRL